MIMSLDVYMDVKYYLSKRFTDPTDKERGAQPFFLKSIHDFYQTHGKSLNSGKLLEFGGGPVLYPLISASPFISEITFADYMQSSIDAITAWKDESKGSHDWSPYFQFVLSELEGCEVGKEELALLRQKDLRKKLSELYLCDLRAEELVTSLPPDNLHKKFDIISTHFCCDAVAKTIEEYQDFVKSLNKYLRPGGFIISLVSLEESYWHKYGDERNFHLFLRKEDVKLAYEMAGFSIVQSIVHTFPESSQHILNDSKAVIFIVGKTR